MTAATSELSLGTQDPRVDAYLASAPAFARPILERLRYQVHRACPQVEETLKLGCPTFMREGLLCRMVAFETHCAFTFRRAKQMTTRAKLMEHNASSAGHLGRIKTLADLPSVKELDALIREAAALNEGLVATEDERVRASPEKPKGPPASPQKPLKPTRGAGDSSPASKPRRAVPPRRTRRS